MVGDRDGRFKYHQVVSDFLKIAHDIEIAIIELESQPSKVEVVLKNKNKKRVGTGSNNEVESEATSDWADDDTASTALK